MSAPYLAERQVIGTLLAANWSTSPIWWPNRKFTPPEPTGDPASPASYLAFEIGYDGAELADLAGGYRVDGRVELGVWVEKGIGDDLTRQHMQSLYSIFSAVDSSGIFFLEPRPGDDPATEGDWYGRALTVPFVHFGALSASEVATLAGIGSTSRTITQAAHGLAAKDWIGFNGSDWVKVAALEASPRCDGVVSSVIDANTFVLTAVGVVTLASHGYSLGPLYLSQGTAGAVTSTAPTAGVSQQVAVAYDTNSIIVLQSERLVL